MKYSNWNSEKGTKYYFEKVQGERFVYTFDLDGNRHNREIKESFGMWINRMKKKKNDWQRISSLILFDKKLTNENILSKYVF